MRVLLVEDNVTFAKSVSREFAKIPDCEVVWAKSRDSAFAQLTEYMFDLLVLDRRIPTADQVLDDASEHKSCQADCQSHALLKVVVRRADGLFVTSAVAKVSTHDR